MAIEESEERVERILSRQERRFRNTIISIIAAINDRNTLDELADLLEAGRFEDALEGLEGAARQLGTAYGNALADAADDLATWISTNALNTIVVFNVSDDIFVNAIRANSLRLISEFTEEQRLATRQAITRGIQEGLNPRDQAVRFRQSIGLTRRQEEAVANYRNILRQVGTGSRSSAALSRDLRDRRFDGTIQRALQNETPLTDEQIERMVGRYRDRYLRYRSETIARTEALRSMHQGRDLMMRQAVLNGEIDDELVRRTWNTSRDGRERDSHGRLHGVTLTGIDAVYQADGGSLRHPGDPLGAPSEVINCRCIETLRIDLDATE